MNLSKRLIAGVTMALGLVSVVAAFGGSSASAYPPGAAATLTASASTVTQGDTLTVTGFHYSGTVQLVGSSAPVDLGTATASGPDGTFTKTVTITASNFPVGTHSISGTDALGDSASVSFNVVAASNGSTGANGSSAGSGR